MNISVNLQLKLAELDIPVVFVPTVGKPLAVVNTILSSKASLRSSHYGPVQNQYTVAIRS